MYVSSQDQKLTHNKLKNMTQAWTRKPCKAFKKALDVFLPVFLSKIIFVTTSHSSGVMVNKTFPIMDEVIHVWAMPEFLNQDCYGGAHKHSLIFKPSLSQLSCLLFNVHIWSEKLKKKCSKKRMKWLKHFFPTIVCFLMWSLKWRCKQINKEKTISVITSFAVMSACTTGGQLFYFGFIKA